MMASQEEEEEEERKEIQIDRQWKTEKKSKYEHDYLRKQ